MTARKNLDCFVVFCYWMPAPNAGMTAKRLALTAVGSPNPKGDEPHVPLHLVRHMIVAHDGSAVAKATRLSLHHQHPERVASLHHQRTPQLPHRRRRARVGGIELGQPGESRFERSPHPPERSSLFLDDLIVENVDASAMKAKITGHRPCIASRGPHAQPVKPSN
jgi:hypothetical protein